jgi:Domain of unknown function (DUF4252)
MKKLIATLTLALITVCPLPGFAQADIEKDPAYLPIDQTLNLKANPPKVNVNLPRFLLKEAVSGLSTNEALLKSGIDLADLLKDVKLIHVVVFEGNASNSASLEAGVKQLQEKLEAKWTPIVAVKEENRVGIYAMGDPSGENMTGVAVLIHSDNNVVIANVVGHVSIGKLIKIAAQSKKLPKDFLKQLQGAGLPSDSSADTKSPANAGETNSGSATESSQNPPKESETK